MYFKKLAFAASAIVALPAASQAANIIGNGDFSNGLTGWTIYNTTNSGSTVAGTAGAVSAENFNVTGGGTQSAARLEVGDSDGPFNGTYGGGGLSQTVISIGGVYQFSANIAVLNSSIFTNASAGHFSALIDGVSLSEINFDTILDGETLRGALSFTTNLSAGSHVIRLQATRNALSFAATPTPYQYFTNVSLANGAAAAVPEPATWAMMLGGFGLVGATMRRRRAVQAHA